MISESSEFHPRMKTGKRRRCCCALRLSSVGWSSVALIVRQKDHLLDEFHCRKRKKKQKKLIVTNKGVAAAHALRLLTLHPLSLSRIFRYARLPRASKRRTRNSRFKRDIRDSKTLCQILQVISFHSLRSKHIKLLPLCESNSLFPRLLAHFSSGWSPP